VQLANCVLAQHLPLADLILVLANSKIEEQGTWDDLRSSTGYVSKLQVKESDSDAIQNAANERPSTVPGTTPPSEDDMLDLSRKSGDFSLYCMSTLEPLLLPSNFHVVYYFRAVGLPLMAMFLFCNIIFGATFAITPTILKEWSESGGLHTWFFIGLYTLSGMLAFATTAAMIWYVYSRHSTCCNDSRSLRASFILMMPKGGEVLHLRLLSIIMRYDQHWFRSDRQNELLILPIEHHYLTSPLQTPVSP